MLKAFAGLVAGLFLAGSAQAQDIPHLARHGTTQQLIVDGKPFLILGGELSNSAASSLDYLQTTWAATAPVGVNTLFAPVEWDQLEPEPGHYDFAMVDGLIAQARTNHVHLGLLWFGAWKNSMSTYAPPYVKRDSATYARARDDKDVAQDILSPFDRDTLRADSSAFAALMAHLKATDSAHTVILVQVENEIGMLPVVRDYGPQAQAAWNSQVPPALIAYLKAHRDSLTPQMQALWSAGGDKQKGTWREVFGDTVAAQEVFQAWYFATYANAVAKAGKAQYPLPMYVNAALIRPGKMPGEYPSAGPLPHLFDVWKAGAPDIDVLGIDMYFPNFAEWADRFKRPDNPFLMPESNQAGKLEAGANAFYAFGQLDGISFSPFAIDHIAADNRGNLTGAYDVLNQLTPQIVAAQGTGRMRGFRPKLAFDGTVDETPQTLVLGGYAFTINFVDPWIPKDQQNVAAHGGLIIQTGDDSFIIAGTGFTAAITDATPAGGQVGLEQIVEGTYADGVWKPGRWLNGDDSNQGRFVHLDSGRFAIQQVKVFRYK